MILLITNGAVSFCQDKYILNIKFEKISERTVVVSESQFAANQIAVQSEKGLILIDTGISPEYAEMIKDSLKEIFGTSQYAYIINTHHHWDHIQGNQVFAGTNIIGHLNCEKGMRMQRPADNINRANVRLEEDKLTGDALLPPPPSHILIDGERGYALTVPTITFKDHIKVRSGNITLHLLYYGECHTDNDIIIYIPEENLLAVGDLFYKNSLPQVGSRENPDIDRWLNNLAWILSEDKQIDYIISGHNEMFSRGELQEYYEYLKVLSEGIRDEITRGNTFDNITEKFSLRSKFPGLVNKDMISNDGSSLHESNIKKLCNYFAQLQENAPTSF